MRLLDRPATKIVALVVALAAAAGIGYELFRPPPTKTAVAYFPVAVHLYPGSEVDVLGVKVGTVTSVDPQPGRVRVVIAYDADRRIPADVKAVIEEPTLVADRVIELTPPYGGGAQLADGATIPVTRTGVPLELDQLTGSLVHLADALGPEGANRAGALTRAIRVGAANLRGEGAQAHRTVTQLADMLTTLGDNRRSLFDSIRRLEAFTSALARHDRETRSFTTDLAGVARELAGDGHAFATALHELSGALTDVAHFIRAHRAQLTRDVNGLAELSHVLARERILLAHMADMGAVGISNYPHMYTPSARTYNARFDNSMTDNPALFVCQLYASVGGSPQQCLKMLAPLKAVSLRQRGHP